MGRLEALAVAKHCYPRLYSHSRLKKSESVIVSLGLPSGGVGERRALSLCVRSTPLRKISVRQTEHSSCGGHRQ